MRVATLMIALSIAGCSRQPPPLLPVSLPDLSRAAGPVRDQLVERFTSLTRRIESGTPASELGTDFGETGKLLMAAEYRRAAEPCFLNAQALAPTDARWPYYLGHLYRLGNDPEKSATFFERALQLQPDHVAALIWLGLRLWPAAPVPAMTAPAPSP